MGFYLWAAASKPVGSGAVQKCISLVCLTIGSSLGWAVARGTVLACLWVWCWGRFSGWAWLLVAVKGTLNALPRLPTLWERFRDGPLPVLTPTTCKAHKDKDENLSGPHRLLTSTRQNTSGTN